MTVWSKGYTVFCSIFNKSCNFVGINFLLVDIVI